MHAISDFVHPASLTHKNSQGPRIIDGLHSLHLLGHNDWSQLAYEQALWGALAVGREKEGEVATVYHVSRIWIPPPILACL